MITVAFIVLIACCCVEVLIPGYSSYISSKSTNFSLKLSVDINLDVWISVMRVGTKWLRGSASLVRFNQFQGWYEGYSAGVPVDDLRINTTKTTYGCWHRAFPSNIYVNVKRSLFIPVKDYAKDYFSKHLHKSIDELGLISWFDKYYCKAALELGYHTLIFNLPIKDKVMDNYEVVVCDGRCSTVTFNTTCAPIEYQHLNHTDNIFRSCNCNDSYKSLNCNNDIYPDHSYFRRHEIAKFNQQYQNNKIHPVSSMYTIHRCIMNFEYIRYKMNKLRLAHHRNGHDYQNDDDLTIIFTTNIINYPSIEYHEKLSLYIKASNGSGKSNSNSNRTVLLLNFETDNHEYFSNNMRDLENLHRLYKYHEINYPISFKQALKFNHSHNNYYYHLIKNWISPWDELLPAKSSSSSSGLSTVLLYSNIDVVENAKIFLVNAVLVAIIMYDTHISAPPRNILSTDRLLQWIHFKAKCLRKLGADVIVVMGNGDYAYSSKILAQNYHLITTVLGTDSLSSSLSSSSHLNSNINLTNAQGHGRVIMLPPFINPSSRYPNHVSKMYVTKIHIHFNHQSFYSITHRIDEL